MSRTVIVAWLTVAALSFCAGVEGAQGKPNVLVILCDDLGYGDLACFGHPKIRTPNLDRLAAQGVRLTACYASAPVCSSSRTGLMTGRTPSRIGVYDWIPQGHVMHMPRTEVTVAQLLKKAGYDTAMAGKWHLNGKFNTTDQPQPVDFGFDHWFATQNNAGPSHENPKNFVRNGRAVGEMQGYSSHIVAGEAIGWLKGRKDKSKPFFLYVAFHEPHEPIASPPELVAKHVEGGADPNEAMYYANVENMDAAVGKLLAALKEEGVEDDTLVFFTSDNGPEARNRYPTAARSWGSPGDLRGMKLWLYEGGIRVPGIVRFPGRVKPGRVSDEPVCGVDLLPTLCELAGVEAPKDRVIDGASFTPIFDGKPIARALPLYWHYYRAWDTSPVAAMREGDWVVLGQVDEKPKPGAALPNDTALIRAPLTSFELYNLRDDPRQQSDRASSEPERLKAMSAKLAERHRRVTSEGRDWSQNP